MTSKDDGMNREGTDQDGADQGRADQGGMDQAAVTLAAPRIGRCTLVGAGPGDPDLLTIKAVRAIRRATVILVDDLVDPRILRWARRSARIVHVGKRGGCRSTPQAFIEKLMVNEALRGEAVVRLKGGDPLIFGRAGEELTALRRAGVVGEVINGISAGLAAAADLGLSLTHRDHAQGVLLVTGHGSQRADDLQWQQIADVASAGVTIVLYMGVARLHQIEAQLLTRLPASTPVAWVERASQPGRRVAAGTLGELAALAGRHGIASPAVLIVGDVLKASAWLSEDLSDTRSVAGEAEIHRRGAGARGVLGA